MHSSACKYQRTPTVSQPPFPTPLRFSIKIQTEIEDLKGSRLWWAGLCRCSRHIGVGGGGGYWVALTPEHPHLTEVSHVLARPHLAHRSRSWSLPTEVEVPLIRIVIEMKDWHWLCVFCGWVLNADGHYLIVTERIGLRFGDVWIFIGGFLSPSPFIRIYSSNITALWCRWLQNIYF